MANQTENLTKAAAIYYLSKVFPERPARYLDRVLKAMFIDPAVTSFIAVAKRRCENCRGRKAYVCICALGRRGKIGQGFRM